MSKTSLREICILRLLDHENVLGIKRLLKPNSREEFDELYVVSELMEGGSLETQFMSLHYDEAD